VVHVVFKISNCCTLRLDGIAHRFKSELDDVLNILPFIFTLKKVIDQGWSIRILLARSKRIWILVFGIIAPS